MRKNIAFDRLLQQMKAKERVISHWTKKSDLIPSADTLLARRE